MNNIEEIITKFSVFLLGLIGLSWWVDRRAAKESKLEKKVTKVEVDLERMKIHEDVNETDLDDLVDRNNKRRSDK